eukprot:CAMPEP_0197729978 /NCGR_PEP_ID=MMETSP1434-20131217/32709_1 /TAXON_ID=265543 /ORGANISM="Minutocellus polymorphus, Strain CCMP3303" /LENGTH=70 /DNA_ID=CAMNT_0043316715 /DNA_START=145 /DNA_END=357 /DNA_ORIENTATION=+
MRSRFAEPREHETIKWGRHKLPSFSRTGTTNGLHSYPHSSSGSICSLSGRALGWREAAGIPLKIATIVDV